PLVDAKGGGAEVGDQLRDFLFRQGLCRQRRCWWGRRLLSRLDHQCPCTIPTNGTDQAEGVAGSQVEVPCDGEAGLPFREQSVQERSDYPLGVALRPEREAERQQWCTQGVAAERF